MPAMPASSVGEYLGHDERPKRDSTREDSLASHCCYYNANGGFYTMEVHDGHATPLETWHMGIEHFPKSCVFSDNIDAVPCDPLAVSAFDPQPAIFDQATSQRCYDEAIFIEDDNLWAQLLSPVDSRALMPLDGTVMPTEYDGIVDSTTLVPSTPPTLSLSPATSDMSGARSRDAVAQAKKHITAEKKYRATIRDSFQMLHDSLPDSDEGMYNTDGKRIVEDWPKQYRFHTGGKLNKASILRKAAEYIRLLQRQNNNLHHRLSELGAFAAGS